MYKVKRKTLVVNFFVLLAFVASTFMMIFATNSSASAATNSVNFEKGIGAVESPALMSNPAGTIYSIGFNRDKFSTSSAENLRDNVGSITIDFYDSNMNPLDNYSQTRAKENGVDKWTTSSSSATVYDIDGTIAFYKISFTLLEKSYSGVYWAVLKKASPSSTILYSRSGSTMSTEQIPVTTTIETCDAMTLVAYKRIEIEVIKSYYTFPAHWSWDLKYTNNNPFPIEVEYLNELCFEGDAKGFGGNASNKHSFTLAANTQTGTYYVKHNGTAGYTTVSFQEKRLEGAGASSFRLVTYANNLKYSKGVGSCTMNSNIVEL